MDKAMINITIDGMACKGKPGATSCRLPGQRDRHSTPLPQRVSGAEGRCRLCMVEVKKGTRVRLVTFLSLPVEEGLQVQTQAEKGPIGSQDGPGTPLGALSDSEVIAGMAGRWEWRSPFQAGRRNWKCILCGQCAKACEEAVGVSAIGLSMRDRSKGGILTPNPPGSGHRLRACHYIAPRPFHDRKKKCVRSIWGGTSNGRPPARNYSPRIPAGVDGQDHGVSLDFLKTCQNCRK